MALIIDYAKTMKKETTVDYKSCFFNNKINDSTTVNAHQSCRHNAVAYLQQQLRTLWNAKQLHRSVVVQQFLPVKEQMLVRLQHLVLSSNLHPQVR